MGQIPSLLGDPKYGQASQKKCSIIIGISVQNHRMETKGGACVDYARHIFNT